MLLNNKWIIEETKEKNLNTYRGKWKCKKNDSKPMGCNRSSSKREVYSNTILPQKTRKISNKQPNLTPKTTTERRTDKTQSYQQERHHKGQSRKKWNRDKEKNRKYQWN